MAQIIGLVGEHNTLPQSDGIFDATDGDDKPLYRMNKDELVELAESKGIATDGLTKAELMEALQK